ncbi:MAG TPA: RNA 2',3'-cyclic phosphodiesterase [Ideonella sp.]|uniref:RNA 2',3'-cyclic phosphodiesterase n=1 Tax=Ideonella sp. TaxID=1929293 RepID=UPI002E2F3BD1|nr:RNA 2',3'-cyclic phosphodiesterase [Ideonella sp.]HEX5687329.1 RNA 2',3'-cyclic phosphodiesterase [Ideonella sp.]
MNPPPSTPPRDPARLFLAMWPDPPTQRAMHAWQQVLRWPSNVRPTAPAHLHLTLHFIGNVPRARLPALASGLVQPFAPFDWVLDEFTVWHHGIAVLQPSGETPAELIALHAGLADALRTLALPVETRPFRPHVTLARHGSGAALPEGTTPPPPVHWRVDNGYVLAESAGGYRVLQRFAA